MAMQGSKFRIVIADDHPIVRAGLKLLVSKLKKFEIAGEAETGQQTIDLIQNLKPDIVILDIDMPQKSGIEVAHHISTCNQGVKIIFLTSHSSFESFTEAIRIPYSGFVFKESAMDEIAKCLEIVSAGQQYISPVFKNYYENNKAEVERIEEIKKSLAALSSSEKRVLKLISEGKTTPAIAAELFNSEKTIENHRYNICVKLNISGTNQLLAFALENKQLINNLT